MFKYLTDNLYCFFIGSLVIIKNKFFFLQNCNNVCNIHVGTVRYFRGFISNVDLLGGHHCSCKKTSIEISISYKLTLVNLEKYLHFI